MLTYNPKITDYYVGPHAFRFIKSSPDFRNGQVFSTRTEARIIINKNPAHLAPLHKAWSIYHQDSDIGQTILFLNAPPNLHQEILNWFGATAWLNP